MARDVLIVEEATWMVGLVGSGLKNWLRDYRRLIGSGLNNWLRDYRRLIGSGLKNWLRVKRIGELVRGSNGSIRGGENSQSQE